MVYEVILSEEAQEHFRRIIHYLIYELRSDQAASRVTDDMDTPLISHLYSKKHPSSWE